MKRLVSYFDTNLFSVYEEVHHMNNSNTGQQLRYLEEISISLHRVGFETKSLEDCERSILWNNAPLCRITGRGSVFYRREDLDTL